MSCDSNLKSWYYTGETLRHIYTSLVYHIYPDLFYKMTSFPKEYRKTLVFMQSKITRIGQRLDVMTPQKFYFSVLIASTFFGEVQNSESWPSKAYFICLEYLSRHTFKDVKSISLWLRIKSLEKWAVLMYLFLHISSNEEYRKHGLKVLWRERGAQWALFE